METEIAEQIAKLGFAIGQYLRLLALVLAGFGAGQLITQRTGALVGVQTPLATVITVAAGLGGLIILLFLFGITGLFTPAVVATAMLLLIGSALLVRLRSPMPPGSRSGDIIAWWKRHWFVAILVMLAVLPLLVRPLPPPRHWDELMYHLPHARLWAEEGGIALNTWIRYPLFPYNYQLLYAAALLFNLDVLTHLIHALAGWLVALAIYFGAVHFFDRRVGVVAAILFLVATRWAFETAYIDLALTLFVFFAFLSLALWQERGNEGPLYLAMFFAALAIGTKYQGLLYLPIIGLLVMAKERRPRVLAVCTFIVLVIGGGWYLRNYLVSGNPVHPLGSALFGYWLWDAVDIKSQFADVRDKAGLPPWYLTASLGGVLLLRNASAVYKGLSFSAAAAVILWAFTSGYARYLTPAYPLLALIAAILLVRIADRLQLGGLLRQGIGRLRKWQKTGLKLTVVFLAARWSWSDADGYWELTFATEPRRAAYYAEHFGSYAILRSPAVDERDRVYQLGFEGEVFLSPVPLRGDWFGIGRYSEVMALADDAQALAQKLRALETNALLINRRRAPFESIQFDERMEDYFELLGRSDAAALYRLR